MSSEKLALERRAASIISPLRYPGSKRRLAGYIKQALKMNGLRPGLFVEPFAGGASVALQLLNDNAVDQIGLIEIDPLVSAFWKTVFGDADWLVEQIATIEITLEQWDRFRTQALVSRREKALACLFLNRTSFSGILCGSGPIGGREQQSQYPIDCRFPRETLIKRIRQAEAMSERVAFVWNVSWLQGISCIRRMQRYRNLPQDIFFYFDPPFFNKAEALYTYYFNDAKHQKLRDFIVSLEDNWILSYDSIDKVRELYAAIDQQKCGLVELLYSTSATRGNRVVEEVILTNLPELPLETRLWRRKEEWRNIKGLQPIVSTLDITNEENQHVGQTLFEHQLTHSGTLKNEVVTVVCE